MLSALDEIAIELNGMAYVMEDDNNVYQAGRLRKISEKLRDISKGEREIMNTMNTARKDPNAWADLR
jgi:hypothetical protein